MYAVTGGCDAMPYEASVHEELEEAVDAMAALLRSGYSADDDAVWDGEARAYIRAEIAGAIVGAYQTFHSDEAVVYRFGSRDSEMFGTAGGADIPANVNYYCGPDWFVAIVKY